MKKKTINLAIDPSLPVPLGVQLRGLIQYGISAGDLKPGDRLPPVRELADAIGVAPMTVVQVYSDMKELGIIEGRSRSGTFIAWPSAPINQEMLGFHRSIDAFIDQGMALGLDKDDIAGLIATRLVARSGGRRRWRLVWIGSYADATRSYAELAEATLGPDFDVEPMLFDQLAHDADALHRAATADLVVTGVYRLREISAALPLQRVVAVKFFPSADTRRALASIEPNARVLAVSLLDDFLKMLETGIRQFAPHVSNLELRLAASNDLSEALVGTDAVIYASGAEAVLDLLPHGVTAIEYRHAPDPAELESLVRSLTDVKAARSE